MMFVQIGGADVFTDVHIFGNTSIFSGQFILSNWKVFSFKFKCAKMYLPLVSEEQ